VNVARVGTLAFGHCVQRKLRDNENFELSCDNGFAPMFARFVGEDAQAKQLAHDELSIGRLVVSTRNRSRTRNQL